MTLAAGFAYPASLFGLWFWEIRPFGISLVRVLFFIGPGPRARSPRRARDQRLSAPESRSRASSSRFATCSSTARARAAWRPALPARLWLGPARAVRSPLPARPARVREGRRMIEARGVGVRFLFDRQRRVVTSAAARLRRAGSAGVGAEGRELLDRPRRGRRPARAERLGKDIATPAHRGHLRARRGADRGSAPTSLPCSRSRQACCRRSPGRENALHLGVLGRTVPGRTRGRRSRRSRSGAGSGSTSNGRYPASRRACGPGSASRWPTNRTRG